LRPNAILRRKNSLLSRYSADMGRMMSRHRAETALRAAAIESALANRAKTAFLATMSHELRTPLNAIIGFSEILKQVGKAPLSAEQSAEYASHISRAGHNLLAVVSSVLDLSRIESGAFKLDRGPHHIDTLINDAIEANRGAIEQKNQTLEVRVEAGLPQIDVDGKRVLQVVSNLLSNANKFTPEGGRIVVVATAENRREITVAVVDSGIGMTEEEVQLALKPFAQVQSQYSRQHEGTGLGLTLGKALVELHGGRLLISSTPDVGTMVAFTLPLEATSDKPANNQPKSFLFKRTT